MLLFGSFYANDVTPLFLEKGHQELNSTTNGNTGLPSIASVMVMVYMKNFNLACLCYYGNIELACILNLRGWY